MNQLAKFGWELENTYVIVDGDYDRVSSEYQRYSWFASVWKQNKLVILL